MKQRNNEFAMFLKAFLMTPKSCKGSLILPAILFRVDPI